MKGLSVRQWRSAMKFQSWPAYCSDFGAETRVWCKDLQRLSVSYNSYKCLKILYQTTNNAHKKTCTEFLSNYYYYSYCILCILKYALTVSLHHFILIYVQLIWMLGLTKDIWNIFKWWRFSDVWACQGYLSKLQITSVWIWQHSSKIIQFKFSFPFR